MIYYSKFIVPSLKRTFYIAKNEKGICYIALHNNEMRFLKDLGNYLPDNVKKSKDRLKGEVKQILEYFAGKRKEFKLSVFLKGTKFQTKALTELAKVRYGETISYTELAKRAGNRNAFRAAATVCASNPVPIIIPCQRVIAKDGSLGGFGGGLSMKREMLAIEKTI